MKKDISIYDFFTIYQTLDDIIVLDVRSSNQFNEYHIPGSINYPGYLLLKNNRLLNNNNNKPFYVIDYDNEIAEEICSNLDKLGIDTICVYGGIKRWMGNFN